MEYEEIMELRKLAEELTMSLASVEICIKAGNLGSAADYNEVATATAAELETKLE